MSEDEPRSLSIERLSIRAFRNFASVDLALGPRFNVVSGDNGQGKTNLIEAVYALATSRSFRATKPGDLVRHDDTVASVRAIVREGDADTREQAVGFKTGARHVSIDGKRPHSLAEYAVRTPAVVFHPGEVALSMGSGGERRRLLDRLSLYLSPSSMAELDSYGKALRSRQKTLETRGTNAPELDEWETLVLRHGTAVMRARDAATVPLAAAAIEAFQRIGAADLRLIISYAPSAPVDDQMYALKLRDRRVADLRRGSATFGPHRDDLLLQLNGRPMRGVASQGQHRAVVLALKSAEIAVIASARGVRPLLLLDDVSSELDPTRTAALFSFLRAQEGQIFLTTTRPELIATGGAGAGVGERGSDRIDFEVRAGQVTRR